LIDPLRCVPRRRNKNAAFRGAPLRPRESGVAYGWPVFEPSGTRNAGFVFLTLKLRANWPPAAFVETNQSLGRLTRVALRSEHCRILERPAARPAACGGIRWLHRAVPALSSRNFAQRNIRDPEPSTQSELRLIDQGARCAVMLWASNAGPANAPTPSAGSPGTRPSAWPSTAS